MKIVRGTVVPLRYIAPWRVSGGKKYREFQPLDIDPWASCFAQVPIVMSATVPFLPFHLPQWIEGHAEVCLKVVEDPPSSQSKSYIFVSFCGRWKEQSFKTVGETLFIYLGRVHSMHV